MGLAGAAVCRMLLTSMLKQRLHGPQTELSLPAATPAGILCTKQVSFSPTHKLHSIGETAQLPTECGQGRVGGCTQSQIPHTSKEQNGFNWELMEIHTEGTLPRLIQEHASFKVICANYQLLTFTVSFKTKSLQENKKPPPQVWFKPRETWPTTRSRNTDEIQPEGCV